MRAERDRRAAILTAEGVKQSQILTAEGERQSSILRAEGDAQAAILRAEGEARAIQKVFDAIHKANPDQKLLAYQYLQMLPQIAQGDSNKLWIVPTELTAALGGIGQGLVVGRGAGMGDVLRASLGLRENGHVADTGGGRRRRTPSTSGSRRWRTPAAALERARAEAAVAVADARGGVPALGRDRLTRAAGEQAPAGDRAPAVGGGSRSGAPGRSGWLRRAQPRPAVPVHGGLLGLSSPACAGPGRGQDPRMTQARRVGWIGWPRPRRGRRAGAGPGRRRALIGRRRSAAPSGGGRPRPSGPARRRTAGTLARWVRGRRSPSSPRASAPAPSTPSSVGHPAHLPDAARARLPPGHSANVSNNIGLVLRRRHGNLGVPARARGAGPAAEPPRRRCRSSGA